MDKIRDKTMSEIKEMSDARVVIKLMQAGIPIEEIEAMDRQSLMNAWADIVLTGKEVAKATVTCGRKLDLEKRCIDFQIQKYEEEREFRRLEAQRMAQKELEGREIRQQELEVKRQE